MHFLLNVFPYLLKSKFVDIMNDRITLAYYRFAKKVMASMFDWVWLPAGALATPTLTKKLKAIDWDVCAARRGGKRSARGTFSQRGGYVGREGEDAKEEEGLVVHPGDDDHLDCTGCQVDPCVQLELL